MRAAGARPASSAPRRQRHDSCVTARTDKRALGELVEHEAAAALARAGYAGPFPADWLLPHLREAASGSTWPGDAPDGLLAVLEAPGFDLAVELLLGPGSFARVLGALEDSEE